MRMMVRYLISLSNSQSYKYYRWTTRSGTLCKSPGGTQLLFWGCLVQSTEMGAKELLFVVKLRSKELKFLNILQACELKFELNLGWSSRWFFLKFSEISLAEAKFCEVWTIRFCSNFNSMWHKHSLRNVWRDFRLLTSALATVVGNSFCSKFTPKIYFPNGYFMLQCWYWHWKSEVSPYIIL